MKQYFYLTLLLAAAIMIAPIASSASGVLEPAEAAQTETTEIKQYVKIKAVGKLKAEVNAFVVPMSQMNLGEISIDDLPKVSETTYSYRLESNGMTFNLQFGSTQLERQFLGLSNKTIEVRGSLLPSQTTVGGEAISGQLYIQVESFMEIVK